VQFAYPLLLWLVAAYFSVVRFLAYLDLRIKHEGWEVELLMRAEGLRLAGKARRSSAPLQPHGYSQYRR
jgi:hypothetical protein